MNLDKQWISDARAAEQLSALMDGELAGAELQQLLDALPELGQEAGGYVAAQSYLVIGDVLRGSSAAGSAAGSQLDFLSALNAKLAKEPALVASAPETVDVVNTPVLSAATPVQMPVHREAANQSVFRWKMVAGFASLAAVAMLGWGSMGMMTGSGAGQQMASAAGSRTTGQGLVQMPVTVGQNATVMLRDPRIDELLAARGQIGGTTNLQMPAGFLRNANFNAERQSGGCPDKASRLC